jgi:hypothetical protein
MCHSVIVEKQNLESWSFQLYFNEVLPLYDDAEVFLKFLHIFLSITYSL